MERYQVILAYDGAQFEGFQRQGQIASGRARTVQGVVEVALREIGWQGQTLLAAGRTDTGVHASGQVIAFDLAWRHSPADLLAALNAHLPADVAAQEVYLARADFHPRFDAVARHYQYRLWFHPVRHPLQERYVWRVWPALEIGRLQQAAQLFIGQHDFAAFGTPPRPAGSTIRTVSLACWQTTAGQLCFDVRAEAFLYHMVRRMVYVQVAAAQGRIEMAHIVQSLENPRGQKPLLPGLAPPHGLTLVEVCYSAEPRRSRDILEENEEIA